MQLLLVISLKRRPLTISAEEFSSSFLQAKESTFTIGGEPRQARLPTAPIKINPGSFLSDTYKQRRGAAAPCNYSRVMSSASKSTVGGIINDTRFHWAPRYPSVPSNRSNCKITDEQGCCCPALQEASLSGSNSIGPKQNQSQ